MKMRLRDIAKVVLVVFGLIIPFGGVFAQNPEAGNQPATNNQALPKDPAVLGCLRTILSGDLNTANDENTYTPQVRRECLQWLNNQAGAQLKEENKLRTSALSLDGEIEQNRVGLAAHRAAEIAATRFPLQEEEGLPSFPPGQGAAPSAKADQVYYEPLIRLGNAKSPNVVYFLWGSDRESREIYKTFVHSVVSGKSPRPAPALFNLVQIVGSDRYGMRDPGSLLFCASDRRAYSALALGYLLSGGNIDKIFSGHGAAGREFDLNGDMVATLHSGNIPLERCLSSDTFYRQLYYSALKEVFFLKAMDVPNRPTLILNGKKLNLKRKSDVRWYWKQLRS